MRIKDRDLDYPKAEGGPRASTDALSIPWGRLRNLVFFLRSTLGQGESRSCVRAACRRALIKKNTGLGTPNPVLSTGLKRIFALERRIFYVWCFTFRRQNELSDS